MVCRHGEISMPDTGPSYRSLEPLVWWMKESRPVAWDKTFGRSAELNLEIGFGLGDYLVRQARENTDENFVGVELNWPPIRRTLRKIAISGVKNVRLMRADVRVALERLFAPRSLQKAWALFPCPWPKNRHEKHRLFSKAFLGLLNSRLVNGGEALMITDDRDHLDWVLSQVPGTGFQAHSGVISPRFRTKYEKKWKALGQLEFHELRLIKCRHMKVPLKEDVTVMTHLVDHFDPDAFTPSNAGGKGGKIVVRFKDVLYDPRQQKGMVRSIVGEDGQVQDFWVEIVRKQGGWRIRPAKGCGIIPTAGVQEALDLVRDAIQGQVKPVRKSPRGPAGGIP
jgi:tRNA (guanine-N7-)-methyltransferase